MKPLSTFYSLLFAFFLLATAAAAQTPKQLYRQFKKCDGAHSIFVPRLLFRIGGIIANKEAEDEDDKKGARLLKRIHAVRILSMDECSAHDCEAFQNALKHINTKGYDTVVYQKEDSEHVRILTKIKKERIRELVIINTAESEGNIILLRCNISPNDIATLVSDVKKMRK